MSGDQDGAHSPIDVETRQRVGVAVALSMGCFPAVLLSCFGVMAGGVAVVAGFLYFAAGIYAFVAAFLFGVPAYLMLRRPAGPRRAFWFVIGGFTAANAALVLWLQLPLRLAFAWSLIVGSAELPSSIRIGAAGIFTCLLVAAASFLLAIMLAGIERRALTSFILRKL